MMTHMVDLISLVVQFFAQEILQSRKKEGGKVGDIKNGMDGSSGRYLDCLRSRKDLRSI